MCILAPTNKLCDEVNDIVMSELPGTGSEYIGINVNMTKHVQPIEFLDRLKVGSLPNTHIRLKVGSIVMCIRNLSDSLNNGTRLRVTKLLQHCIAARIITDVALKDKEEIIFPIKFIHEQASMKFSRTQLPIRISYAMTISKIQ